MSSIRESEEKLGILSFQHVPPEMDTAGLRTKANVPQDMDSSQLR